jgi:hypothetical protein
MQRRVSMLAIAAALLSSNAVQAAPWSFDPERVLTAWSDEARCVARADWSPEPDTTGSVADQPLDDGSMLEESDEDLSPLR